MKDAVVYLLYKLLRKNKISVDEEEVKFQLLSHPTYPSLHSLTGVLDHFSIDNVAAKVSTDNDTLSQLGSYFLTQIKNETGEHFVIFIKDKDQINIVFSREYTQTLSEEEFLQIWTGVILLIDSSTHQETSIYTKSKTTYVAGTIFFGIFLIVSFLLLQPKAYEIIFYLFSFIGLGISILILQKELGLQSKTIDKLCASKKKNIGCDQVLNSKGATLFKTLKLSDASLVYFSSLILSSFFLLHTGRSLNMLYTLSIFAIPVTLYSIFYQLNVLKSWCVLCLGIVCVIWLQTAMLFTLKIKMSSSTFDFFSIALIFVVFVMIWSSWLWIAPLIKKEIELNKLKIDHYRFKRNYAIFDFLLSRTEVVPKGNIDPNEIILGDKSANPKLNIIVITTPSCKHCKEAHELVELLLEQFEKQVQIVLRFNVPALNKDDDATKITARLIELYHNSNQKQCLEAMHEAYNNVAPEQWIKKWGVCTDEVVFNTLQNQNKWCIIHNKNFTPEILIEGKSFPKEYNKKELLFFVEDLLE